MPLRVGSCLSFHRSIWRDKGAEPWVVEALRLGYRVLFSSPPLFSVVLLPLLSYSMSSTKGKALHGEVLSLISKGAVELAPSSSSYYSRLFVVWKAMGSWRPVIDLSHPNCFVQPTRFKMETNQSVLRSVWRTYWMFSINIKDAYLQVLVHPDSQHYLQFVADGQVYWFKALCFGLSMASQAFTWVVAPVSVILQDMGIRMAPQAFSWVMAPVSVILHDMGIRILRYLNDWLVLASSRVEALWARDKVLDLCRQLGIVVNHAKSHLIPSCSATYLEMYLKSPSLKAFPSQERVSTLRLQIDKFLSCRQQGVIAWRSLLGQLSSLYLFVPVGRLRMRSLQLELRRRWDFVDESVVVSWTPKIELDLWWWYDTNHPIQGVSFKVQHPALLFWSDASDQGWGAHLHDQFVASRWLSEERSLSINLQELLAIRWAPAFQPVSAGQDSRSLHGQYDSPVICQEATGDILHGAQPGGATSPLGRVHR